MPRVAAIRCATLVGGMDMLPSFADHRDPKSTVSKIRLRRIQWFASLIENLPRPISILDVGGTKTVWERIGFADQSDISITVVNIDPSITYHKNIAVVLADARNLQQFTDGQFDVVYSNSVIEHLGDLENMRKMANEVRRVGKRYFVQTPNRNFPIEPHFLFPLFQFLPRKTRIALTRYVDLGWIGRQPNWQAASLAVDSINLLSAKQMRELFPDAVLKNEILFGLVKSLIAYKI
jgi:SAM-dependent methyltransferase